MSDVRSRAGSLALVTLAYVIAVAAAALWLRAGPHTGRLWLDVLIADVIATVVVFIFSRVYRNSSFYDAFWSVIPPLLFVYWWWQGPIGLSGPGALRCWLLALVVGYWAVRLTANWAMGFPGLHHEDWRYPLLRDGAPRFEFLIDYIAATRPGDGVLWLAWVAFAIGVAAVTLELTADTQMRRFVAGNPGRAMDQGLWAWSRHPNYVGEIGFWLSMALFGVAAAPADWWWLFVCVAVMVAMFLGASIPMMEKRSLERRPEYQDVVDRVPRLLPRPPRKAQA